MSLFKRYFTYAYNTCSSDDSHKASQFNGVIFAGIGLVLFYKYRVADASLITNVVNCMTNMGCGFVFGSALGYFTTEYYPFTNAIVVVAAANGVASYVYDKM